MSTTTIAAPAIGHSVAIRAEIEADVRALIERCYAQEDVWRAEGWEIPADRDGPTPRYLSIGYTIAMHRGRDLYREGDLIAGLPVTISRRANRSITVSCDPVWVEMEDLSVDSVDSDDCDDCRTRSEERTVSETITW